MSCIQYLTYITSVLFCGLTNNYIRILVHRLNNPVFVFFVTDNVADRDCSRIELPRLYIANNLVAMRLGRFYTHSCNHSIITTLFQTYLLTLSQINSKNYLFHALKLTKCNLHEVIPSVCAMKRNDEK